MKRYDGNYLIILDYEKEKTVVILITIFLMFSGMLTCIFQMIDSGDDACRQQLLRDLIQKIDSKYRYISSGRYHYLYGDAYWYVCRNDNGSYHGTESSWKTTRCFFSVLDYKYWWWFTDFNGFEFEQVFGRINEVMSGSIVKMSGKEYMVLDEIKSSFCRLYRLAITSRYGDYTKNSFCFYMIVPLRNEETALESGINSYVERFNGEYDFEVKSNVMHHNAYFLLEASEDFFSQKKLAKNQMDDRSLYELYCLMKLAKEVSEME